MTDSGLKLSYNPAQLRVRLEAPASTFRALSALPADIVTRAQNKLKHEQQQGTIIDAATSFAVMEQFITRLRSSEHAGIPDNHAFTVTLALGIPALARDFHIDCENSSEGLALYVSLPDSEKVRQLSYPSFVIAVRHLLKQLKFKADHAQLAVLYRRACQGETIVRERLLSTPRLKAKAGSGPVAYRCFFHTELATVVVRVYDLAPLLSEAGRAEFMAHVRAHVQRHPGLVMADSFLNERLAMAISGIEAVGLSLPLDLLAAWIQGPRAGATAAASPAPTTTARSVHAPQLQVIVSEDALTAKVTGFDKRAYVSAQLDEAWLRGEVERLRLRPLSGDQLKKFGVMLKARADLNGAILAQGQMGQAGDDYFIRRHFAHAAAAQGDGAINVRQARAGSLVKAGEAVAILDFESPPKLGTDVYGKQIPPPLPEGLKLTIGEGIELRSDLHFYARTDGVLALDRSAIALTNTLIHKGDVNLVSGDIDFNGPIIVQGNIDAGAQVRSSSDIRIEGSVRGGQVASGGKLTVTGGVNVAQSGLIFSRGDMQCEFIENSVVVCLGNLLVSKNVLNSRLFVAGNITLDDNRSVLAGGVAYLWGELNINNLGLPSGLDTQVYLGCNWRWARRFDANHKRQEFFKEHLNRLRKELQEVKSKAMQKSLTVSQYQLKIDKTTRIVERCDARHHQLKREKTFNKESRAMVRGKVQPRCHIFADGRRLIVPEGVYAIAILAFAQSGEKDAHIKAIDQVRAGPPPTGKEEASA